jgi:putative Holliday junction resolvase
MNMHPGHDGTTRRPQTVMAFDYGLRHIGVAVGNSLIASANPVAVISARDGVPDWNALSKLLREWQPVYLVIGLPLNMDGSESEMSLRASRFARQLNGRFSLPANLTDERLSSFAAKQARRELGDFRDTGVSTVDAEAACLILLDHWRSLRGSPIEDGL